jgi:hypothetical protein
MEKKKMMVEEKKNKERTKEEKNKKLFKISTKGGKKNPPTSMFDLGSSQNSQRSLIHNCWCIGGWWFIQANNKKEEMAPN